VSEDDDVVALVLTALDVEYEAVRAHLVDPREWHHPKGTIFEVGVLPDSRVRVVLALAGQGNAEAGVIAERGLSVFKPAALLFVGIAGALRDDLTLGDVVVATHVYAYHGGREETGGFRARPRVWHAPHDLDQLARHVARARQLPPRVHFGPVASGEVVLNSRGSPTAERIDLYYNDAIAIEMESAGVAQAAHMNAARAMVVRGVSDLADGSKDGTDRSGWRGTAAGNAAAFAFALIARLPAASAGRSTKQGLHAVSGADPHVLGVHPAIAVGGVPRRLPAYVDRDTDTAPDGVRASLGVLMRTGGMLVLVGGSSTGKTRTAYEAVAALLPEWRLVLPAGGLPPEAPPRSVVWLDELARYLDDPAVTSLLTAAPPVVLIGTMWPEEHAAAVIARRPDGSPAPAARVLDLAVTVWLGDRFSDIEQRRAEHLAADDVQLRAALEASDHGVTQSLAAAPQLMARVRGAGPIAAAVIMAAVDAVRLGVRSPLPAELLEAAAPGYCDPRTRAAASPEWFAEALAYVTQEVRGAAAVLTPVGAVMGSTTGYRLADYVHQTVARERRSVRPPEGAWQASLATATDPDDLERLAVSAEVRGLFGHARDGYTQIAHYLGRSSARTRLAALLTRAGDMSTLERRAAHGDDAADRALAAELFRQGDAEGLSARAEAGSLLARERLAALLAERDLSALATLAEAGGAVATHYLNVLIKAGHTDEALAFMRRQAGQDPTGLPDNWWAMQVLLIEGNLDELTHRAERSVAPHARPLLAQARARLGELQQLRDAADTGDESSAIRLADELDRRDAEDELHARAGRGDWWATRMLATRQARTWLAAGDVGSLRERAATDPWATDTYADALAAIGDVDTLGELADAGNDRAARHAAALLARAGDLARLRDGVDLGRPHAVDALADALAAAGRTDEAERLRHFGLRADGEIASRP